MRSAPSSRLGDHMSPARAPARPAGRAHMVAGWVIPSSAVVVAGSRFTEGPCEYVLRSPFGDGVTRFASREAAFASAKRPEPAR